jgi:LPS export ABC transporter permease LptF/LPS export ABC transporter permease LptG
VRILDRYIWKELVTPFGLGLLIFTFLLLIDRIFDLTDLIINKGVPVHLVLMMLVYIAPAILVLTIPIGFLLAILVAFGRLSADMEVVAFKACGVSPLRLLGPVVAFGLGVTALTAYLMIDAVPKSNYAFKSLVFEVVRTQATVGLKERLFNDTFGNFVIYVDEIATDQVALRNVFVSDERKPDEQRFITAREGRLLSDEVNRRVTLRLLDGAIHETSPQALQKYREVRFRLYDITLVLENPLVKQGGAPKGDREMSLTELRTATQNAVNLKGNPNPFLVEIHKKFAIPTACVVFSLLGVPLGIRAHRGGRMGSFVALLPIVLFYYFGLTLGENIGDHGRIPPWLAMWLPNIIVGAIALYLLRANLKERPIPLVALIQRGFWATVEAARALRPTLEEGAKRARHALSGRPLPRRRRVAVVAGRPVDESGMAGSRAPLVYGFVVFATVAVVLGIVLQDRIEMSTPALALTLAMSFVLYWVVAWLCIGAVNRYLSRQFLTLFCYGMALAAVVVIVGDLMTTLERYIRLKPGIGLILMHFVYRTPPFVYQGLHLVMLMSTILLFAGLSRSNELTALKAGGVSLYRVSLPVFGLALLISMTSLGFQEYVMPWMNRRATEIDEAKIKRRTMPELRKRTEIWYRGREDGAAESRIYHIGLLDPGSQQMNNVTVLSLGPDFAMRRRWDARDMRWVSADDAWRLGTGVRREFRSGQPDRAETFKEQTVKLPERYQDFAQVPRAPDVMSYRELREYIDRLQDAGHKVAKYIVDLQSKVSFPLAHPIMVLVGIPFALQSPRGGRVIGIALCLALGLAYFIVHSAAVALARTEILPPLVAAWSANALFATLGLFLYLRART